MVNLVLAGKSLGQLKFRCCHTPSIASVMPVIVNQRLVNKGVLQHLELKNLTVSSTINADLIFTNCTPSLGIVLCEGISAKVLEMATKVQHQFKNAVAICIGTFRNEDWNAFQMAVPGSNMRIMRVSDLKAAVALALECHDAMKDVEKQKLQSKFFAIEKEAASSVDKTQAIIFNALAQLGISNDDAHMISVMFPSIRDVVCASQQQMEGHHLLDEEVAQAVVDYFGAATPTIR